MPNAEDRLHRALLLFNVALSGVFFGVLQWSVFFLLQSYMASTALIYLLATCCWMLGSVAGLALGGRAPEGAWLGASLLAYYGLRALSLQFPYEASLLPVLLLAVAAMGFYAGDFFRRRRPRFANTKWLFFLENTGFVGGMLATAVSLCLQGDAVLSLAPALLGAFLGASLLLFGARRGHAHESSQRPAA